MNLPGWLEALFGLKKDKNGSLAGSTAEEGFVSKDIFYEILDLNTSVTLFFTKEDGWIGANKAFFSLFDFQNLDQFRESHESIREIFESESEEVFTEYDKSWLDYIHAHRPDGYSIVIKDKNGIDRTFLAKSNMIKQNRRELYILKLEDVTDLKSARKEAMEVERLKSKFLSNIGHEFRTPMNGILGFIELLEKSDPTEKQSEYLQMVHTSAQSLMTNIESLLDLAQMQSGRLNVSNSEFNPIAEMEELAQLYSASAHEKGISLTFFIDPKLPIFINGDLRKLKQVLNNLVNNALKFTKHGGKVNIEVKMLKLEEQNRSTIGFSVNDNGKGIAQKELALITQPFVSGDQADERLGVGLSLSNGMIELLGGKLNIQSEEGVGSTFSFTLNFDASTEHPMRLAVNKTVKVVLLDEARIEDANLLTHYLRSFGMTVIKVHMIEETIFENVDMIYIVGAQDGSEWSDKMGTYTKKCKVVLLLDSNETLQEQISDLVDYILEKPLVPSQISHHLTHVYKLPKTVTKMEEIRQERIRALIAEDNLINQRLIKILLEEYNIEVITALNGLEAVKACETDEFDIIFMDIDMPIKDGILATQEIKEREMVHTPIVALTAMAMEGDRERILEEGLDDYLSKPMTREKLENILLKHLRLDRVGHLNR